MSKFFLYLVLILFLSNCGFKDNKVEKNPNAITLFEKLKPIEQELNPTLNVKISTITKGTSSTLILTFFFRYMKELIELGYIYIATPPLYLVKKGQKNDYAWNDDQRDKLIQEFGSGTSVQRYKGLGEMNAEQLWNTTMDPDRRTLRRVTYDPMGNEADKVFTMLMGDEVPPRRDFIERNAIYANIDA